MPTETLSKEQVLEFRDKAFKSYFLNSDYLLMLHRIWGWDAYNKVTEMCETKIERVILK